MALSMDITTSHGLRCYREIAEKEKRAAYIWETRFGKQALKERYADDGERNKDPNELVRLGDFQRQVAMPLSAENTLAKLRLERTKLAIHKKDFEASIYPFASKAPVSQLAVSLWGDGAWHSQPRPEDGQGAEPAYVPPAQQPLNNTRKVWNTDHTYYKREGLGPASTARALKEHEGLLARPASASRPPSAPRASAEAQESRPW